MKGQVNEFFQPCLALRLYDGNRLPVEVEVAIDTGFSGFLTLPPSEIARLQLPYDSTDVFTLGDNRDVEFKMYAAYILIDETEIESLVMETDGEPLMGIALLKNHTLFIDFQRAGEVRIERRN